MLQKDWKLNTTALVVYTEGISEICGHAPRDQSFQLQLFPQLWTAADVQT